MRVQPEEAPHRYRWVILGVLWITYIVVFLNRLSVGPLAPFFKEDLGIASTQVGLVMVVKNREIIKGVADAVQEKVDTLTNWPEAEEHGETAERYRQNASFFREAPVLIVTLTSEYKSVVDLILSKRGEKDPLAKEMIEDRRSAPTGIQQMGGFVAHFLLTFHSMGLGACWMSGPLIAKKKIEGILEVGEGWNLVALVPVGYPAESPPAKPRKAVDELVEFVR